MTCRSDDRVQERVMLPVDTVVCGDALAVLKTFDENSIDAIVADPPSSINFMNMSWDHDRGGREAWIAWLAAIMREALRVLKPGGHALIWALPRTSHWTAIALEDAGFQIRDVIYHVFGSGFPKSTNISKNIDKHFKAERETIGVQVLTGNAAYEAGKTHSLYHSMEHGTYTTGAKEIPITSHATDAAKTWDGWQSALKPAVENWILCRKPLSEKNIAENVLLHGTGGLNIDVSRIAGDVPQVTQGATDAIYGGGKGLRSVPTLSQPHTSGRFPANILLSHTLFCTTDACSAECPVLELDRQSGKSKSTGGGGYHEAGYDTRNGIYGKYGARDLPRNVGKGDQGGASRYFKQFYYCPKASSRERSSGCDALPELLSTKQFNEGMEGKVRSDGTIIKEAIKQRNNHPTVKSTQLMNYLCNLICPSNGIVLDMFAGSGSTLVAAIQSNMHFIGIEQSQEYVDIANARIAWARGEMNV